MWRPLIWQQLFWRAVGLMSAICLLASSAPISEAAHVKASPKKHRIVYQLDDAPVDHAKFVLRNMRNHVSGVGGWRNIEAMELVVFGPALKLFVTQTIDPDIKRALEALQTEGLVFGVCGNTMKNFSISIDQLPDGSNPLPQGGVVRIMELQELGFTYLRP